MAEEIAIKRIYELGSLEGSTAGYYIALDKAGNTNAVKISLAEYIASLNHNDFGGKQGGAVNEYYHLTAQERTNSQVWQPVTGGINYSGGNVGIGITPSYTLDINGYTRTKSFFIVNDDIGVQKGILFKSNNKNRWFLNSNSTAESGSNVGSDFEIIRYSDNGSSIGTCVYINRANGNVAISKTTADAKLDVNGSIKSNGTIYGNTDQEVALEKNSVSALTGNTGSIDLLAKTDFSRVADGNCTYSITNLGKTDRGTILYFTQDTTGGRTLTLTASGITFLGEDVDGSVVGTGVIILQTTDPNTECEVVIHMKSATECKIYVNRLK